MKTSFIAESKNGKFAMRSDREVFEKHLKKNPGMRYEITPLTPESIKQRRFFEGAVIPMIVFYQEGLDHRKPSDCRKVHEWVKEEFNPEFVTINGETKRVAGSTKGKLQEGLLETVMDWMSDQGYKVELLKPKDYLKWRDVVFPYGGPDNFIDYLVELKKLP